MISTLRQYAELPRAVHILCAGTLLNRVGMFLMVFLTLYLKTELGLSTRFAGLAMGAFGLGALAASLIGGHLADRVGRRAVMIGALFGGAAILVVVAFLRDPLAIVATLTLYAVVTEAYRPAASAMIADLVEPARRPEAFGLMFLAINLGAAISPVLGGVLIQYLSFKWIFWGDAATTAAYGLIIFLAIRETLPTADDGPAGDRHARATTVSFEAALRHMLGNVPFVVFCLATFGVAVVYMQCMSSFPLHLAELGIDAQGFGRIIFVNGTMIVLLQIPVTAIVTRFNRVLMIALGAVLTGAGFGLFGWVSTPGMWMVGVGVFTVGEMMAAPLLHPIVTDVAPVALRARYMGVFAVSFSGANMLGAPLGAAVLASYGGQVLWSGAATLALLSAGLYLTMWRPLSGMSALFVNAAHDECTHDL